MVDRGMGQYNTKNKNKIRIEWVGLVGGIRDSYSVFPPFLHYKREVMSNN